MKALTVNELLSECLHLQKEGKGNQRILISSDDEGNGYHELFFGFTLTKDASFLEHSFVDYPHDIVLKEYMVLG